MNRYEISSNAIIRASNFSITEFEEFLNNVKSGKNLEIHINLILNNEKFMKALYIASENLYNSLINFSQLNEKSRESTIKSLIKYIYRACFRSTPFGLFSGAGEVNLIDSNENELNYINVLENNLSFEVSTEYIFEVYNDVCNNIEKFKNSKLMINPNISIENDYITLYIIGEHYKKNDNKKIYLKNNYIIQRVINLLGENEESITKIINILSTEFKLYYEDIIILLKNLLNERILLLESYPLSNYDNNFKVMYEFLKKNNNSYLHGKSIDKVNNLINKENINNFGIIKELNEIMRKNYNCKSYLLVNSYFSNYNKNLLINKSRFNELIDLLLEFKCIPNIDNYLIEHYKNLFLDKYGYDRVINLSELFDESKGLGSPFVIKKISLDYMRKVQDYLRVLGNLIETNSYYLDKTKICNFNREFISEINNIIEDSAHEIWDGFDMNFKLIHENNKRYFLVDGIATSLNPGGFAGRFSKINDNKDLLGYDHTGIIYWPNDKRLWNVISKKNIFNRNILVNGNGIDENFILIKDIKIFLDRDNTFIITDKDNNRINVDSYSMANISLKHDIIKFLELISNKSTNIFNFIYSINSLPLSHISRLQMNEIILFPESWRIYKSEFEKFNNIKELFMKRNIPFQIVINEGDQILPINILNKYDEIILEEYIMKNEDILISEKLTGSLSDIVRTTAGELSSEITLTILSNDKKKKLKNKINDRNCDNRIQTFNGEFGWVYFSFYIDESLQDEFLKKYINIFFKDNLKGFYIRYADPKPHLRIRIYIEENEKETLRKVFELQSSLLEKGFIHDFKINTYIRELERYGYHNIEKIEQLFCTDSLLCLEILKFKNLVDDNTMMGILIKIQLEFYKDLYRLIDYKMIFYNDLISNKQNKYKYDKLKLTYSDIELNQAMVIILQKEKEELKEIISKLKEEFSDEYIISVIDSIIHMYFNRIYGDNSKENEVRTYIYREIKKIMFYKGKR